MQLVNLMDRCCNYIQCDDDMMDAQDAEVWSDLPGAGGRGRAARGGGARAAADREHRGPHRQRGGGGLRRPHYEHFCVLVLGLLNMYLVSCVIY